jgi:hypothetical protein
MAKFVETMVCKSLLPSAACADPGLVDIGVSSNASGAVHTEWLGLTPLRP